MPTLRHPEKFESADTLISYSFPLSSFEWDTDESFRIADVPSIGSDFAYDTLRSAVAPRNVATETIRYFIVGATVAAADSALDEARQKCLNIGRGKLWQVDATGARRWAWARIAAMPKSRVAVGMARHQPLILTFKRYSPWFTQTQTSTSNAVAASPTIFTVANSGNVPAKLMVIRLRANTAAGIVDPVIKNLTNNYQWSSTRDSASINSEIRVDTEKFSVEYSNDDGASYANDFSLFTIGANQAGFFQLEPGTNSIQYTGGGAPSLQVEFSFFPPNA